MSKSVARNVTRQPLHRRHYRGPMIVRRLESRDLESVVARVHARLARDARRNELLNPNLAERDFTRALRDAIDQTWVADEAGRVVGHLYGAVLESPEYGRGVWVGPDGVSFDDADTLAALYAEGGAAWIEQGALEHYAWVFDDAEDTKPWFELGFARMHERGVLALGERRTRQPPPGYLIRRGDASDLDLALELDEVLDTAQQPWPEFLDCPSRLTTRGPPRSALRRSEVHYYVVECAGSGRRPVPHLCAR